MLFDQSAKGAGEKLHFLFPLLSYLFSGKVARGEVEKNEK